MAVRDRYGRSIGVKLNVAEVLRREFTAWYGRWRRDRRRTDPYQPAEGRYRLTRACIEVLRDVRQPFSIMKRVTDRP
jgi:DNA repair photolyase